MTISELIASLEEMRDAAGEDCEVRLMTQEAWPFENDIVGVTLSSEIPSEDDEDEDDWEPPEESDDICYIVEGRQICYGNKNAWHVTH